MRFTALLLSFIVRFGQKFLLIKIDGIEGLGPKRKQALMKHFKSIGNIQSASLQEIAEAGVPYKVAELVKEKLK